MARLQDAHEIEGGDHNPRAALLEDGDSRRERIPDLGHPLREAQPGRRPKGLRDVSARFATLGMT